MRKNGTVVLCMVALVMSCIVLAVPASAGEDELCIPLGTLGLEPPDGVDQKRPSVPFPHSVHFGYKCQQCHHTWTGDTEIATCATGRCHGELEAPKDEATGKTDPAREIQYYKKAYHTLCIGCHKEITEQNKALERSRTVLDKELAKTGPTGCVKCHSE